MKAKEYTCIVCGARGIDRSSTGERKFCSKSCSATYWRMTHGVRDKSPGCLFNEGVACEIHRCVDCGWHPNVEQRRKRAFR